MPAPSGPGDSAVTEEAHLRDAVARLKQNPAHMPAACGSEAKGPGAGVAFSELRWASTEKTRTESKTIRITEAQSRCERLLREPKVRSWYQDSHRKSAITADVRLRRLGLLCEELGIKSPVELAAKDSDVISTILGDHADRMLEAGHAPGYVTTVLKMARSWLRHCNPDLNLRPLRIKDADIPVTLLNERVPEGEELRELLASGTPKARVIKSLINSGFRPGAIGSYEGTDGLKIGDLPDLESTPTGLAFSRRPSMVVIRPQLSKTGRQYFSFLTSAKATLITAYLNERAAKGEKLTLDSPVVESQPGHIGRRFMTSDAVRIEAWRSMRSRKRRPYVLRHSFDTQLLNAEAKGLIPHDFRVFWMGHKGSIEAVYTTNHRRLPESLLSEMRAAFLRAEPFIESEVDLETEKKRSNIMAKVTQADAETLGELAKLLDDAARKL